MALHTHFTCIILRAEKDYKTLLVLYNWQYQLMLVDDRWPLTGMKRALMTVLKGNPPPYPKK